MKNNLHYYEVFVDLPSNRKFMETKAIKYPYYWLTLAMSIGLTANAQKLPNVQQAGLYAPTDVKVDGKAMEWDNKFQAYNKSTSILYTIANNTDNLFLVAQAIDKTTIDKILGGGITLTISNAKDKTLAPVSITSPIIPPNKSSTVGKFRTAGTDSLLIEVNKEISAAFKELHLKGVGAIPDSLISVYNEYGIKALGLMDINKAYTFELVVPIKYLSQLINAGGMDYKIQLNSIKINAGNFTLNGVAADPSTSPAAAEILRRMSMEATGPMAELMNPTNFSGNYTLAKK